MPRTGQRRVKPAQDPQQGTTGNRTKTHGLPPHGLPLIQMCTGRPLGGVGEDTTGIARSVSARFAGHCSWQHWLLLARTQTLRQGEQCLASHHHSLPCSALDWGVKFSSFVHGPTGKEVGVAHPRTWHHLGSMMGCFPIIRCTARCQSAAVAAEPY